jgi:hypothetical protein
MVSMNWIEKSSTLRYPNIPTMPLNDMIFNCCPPEADWLQFPLVKIKQTSG